MSVKAMTPVKGNLNKITPFAYEAATVASDGLSFVLPRMSDEYVIVLLQNTDAAAPHNVSIKAPVTGSYCASDGDEMYNLPAGANAIFRFESAKWANRDSSIQIVPDNAAVKAVVLY